MKKTDIVINICLDDNKIPEKMSWSAKDGGVKNQSTKALLFSSWDDKNQETMKIDLWTKDMPIDQMNVFFTKPWLACQSHTLKQLIMKK